MVDFFQARSHMRMYLHGDEAAGEFTSQLLAIGDGKYPIDTGSAA